MGLISEKIESLVSKAYQKSGSSQQYLSATDDSQPCYCVLAAMTHQKFQSKFLVHEFPFTDIFSDINHDYRAAILNRNSLWLLSFFMDVATYFYPEKVRRGRYNVTTYI